MIIIIGNQKGGAGKSTLTLLLANFLTLEKKASVTVLDMDYQQSISQKFEKAKVLENAEPYQVLAANLDDFPMLRNAIDRNPAELLLVDLPGKLDDDGLIPVFNSADLVICPFSYDEFSFDSTVLFAVVLRKINPKIPIVFVPNRVKANAKFEIMEEVDAQLKNFGSVMASLPDRVDFQRTTTFYTPLSLVGVTQQMFEQIYSGYIYGKYEIPG